MEKDTCSSINSPVILKNTPIKRLGLSRKRKSSGSDGNSPQMVKTSDENVPLSPDQSESVQAKKTKITEPEITDTESVDSNKDVDKITYYTKEIENLKKRIQEKNEKLEELKSKNENIVNLENLVELWKDGCKNAFLYFIKLIKEKHPEHIDNETILKRLGILEIMTENFENDSEIFSSDD